MLRNNADARRCSYFELGLPVAVVSTITSLFICLSYVVQLYLLSTRREKSKAHRTDQCTNFKSETIYLPTILANHFFNGTTGQLLIKENEFASVLVSRALIFLVVNKTLIKFMDYPYGQPLKWTTPLWFTDLPLK